MPERVVNAVPGARVFRLISIVVSAPQCGCGHPSSILGWETMSRIVSLCSEVWSQGETGEDVRGEADQDI